MLVNCQGFLSTPVIEYSTFFLSNKLPSTISRDNTKNGCEADYNKPPKKRLLKKTPQRKFIKTDFWSDSVDWFDAS